MPEDLPLGVGVSYPPRGVLQRPELAALVAAVASDWAGIELRLGRIYSTLIDAAFVRNPKARTISRPTNVQHPWLQPLGEQVFDEVFTVYNRIKLIKNLAEWTLESEPELWKEMKRLLEVVRAMARIRNDVAHANWGLADRYPDALIQESVWGQPKIYRSADFEDSLKRIDTLAGELDHLWLGIGQAVHPPQRKLFLGGSEVWTNLTDEELAASGIILDGDQRVAERIEPEPREGGGGDEP